MEAVLPGVTTSNGILTRSLEVLLIDTCSRPRLEFCHGPPLAHPHQVTRRVIKCPAPPRIEQMSPTFDRNSLEVQREEPTTMRSSPNNLDLVQAPAGEQPAKIRESHSHKGWQWGDQSRDGRERIIAGPSWRHNALAMSVAYILTRSHDTPFEIDPGQNEPSVKRDQ